jgi:cytochrome P450
MFATGDTLAINALRALALLATHPRQRAATLDDDAYLEACLEEAMRLWPTTTMLSRETLAETEWGGVSVPAGTQVLIPNLFLHRDRDRHDYADRFAPERWVSGEAAGDWSFNHFSHGPQGCPGAGLALFVGKAMLATILLSSDVEVVGQKLDPSKPMPHMLDYFGLRYRLKPR